MPQALQKCARLGIVPVRPAFVEVGMCRVENDFERAGFCGSGAKGTGNLSRQTDRADSAKEEG
jgi:hypothetical protein